LVMPLMCMRDCLVYLDEKGYPALVLAFCLDSDESPGYGILFERDYHLTGNSPNTSTKLTFNRISCLSEPSISLKFFRQAHGVQKLSVVGIASVVREPVQALSSQLVGLQMCSL